MKIAPVLLLVFNRPEKTSLVLRSLREAGVEKLYVVADGPRRNVEGDIERCRSVKRMISDVDWADVKADFRAENTGCGYGIQKSIDWFFHCEGAGIIIEDDCIGNESLFQFCSEMLRRYAAEPRVATISGFTLPDWQLSCAEDSYAFSKHFVGCGWATWADRWQNSKYSRKEYVDFISRGFLNNFADGLPEDAFSSYWEYEFAKVNSGELEAWDYEWLLKCWMTGRLHIVPKVNLVTNIGFDADATHTSDPDSPLAHHPCVDLSFPYSHPPFVLPDQGLDKAIVRHFEIAAA